MATQTPMPRINKRGRYVLGGLVAAILLLTVGGWAIGLYTRYAWFDSVGYTGVWSTVLQNRAVLFLIFGVLLAVWTAANLIVAYRFRPDTVPHTPEQQNMERYRSALEPRIRWWIAGLAIVVGIFAGTSAQNHWQEWMLFNRSRDFGTKDPELGLDVGFYVFQLPFLQYAVGVGFVMIVVGIAAAIGTHYLYGAVRLAGRGDRITSAARWHLSILVGLFLVMKAIAYFMDRYALPLENNQSVGLTGGGYTEMTALLPAKEILAVVAVLAAVAIVVFSNFYARNLMIPGMALGLVAVCALALGVVYPASVNQFSVQPNIPAKEGKYVEYAINGTLEAYGMSDLEKSTFDANSNANPEQLDGDSNTVPSTRMMDPSIVSDAFTQGQRARGFQEFNQKLDVDFYEDEDGELQDYVVGLRELNPEKLSDDQNWVVRHSVYTHGYGLVSAPTNEVCQRGPYFTSGSLLNMEEGGGEGEEGEGEEGEEGSSEACRSDSDFIDISRPQIYFGELNDQYAIVGAPEGSEPVEYDRPASGTTTDENTEDTEETTDDDAVYTTYEGDGGVPVNSFWKKLAYAVEFSEPNFVLSDVFNEDSQLLYDRTPRERVQKVAPFLTVDSDPFPTVVDGEIKWVLDGYTTSDNYPYSDRINLQDATADSTTGEGASQQESQEINYMRNSVKATVDAYTGEVELYKFGEEDPLLEVWNDAFGGIVQPQSEIPDELASHLRYPVDQFKVQRDLLQRFHVTKPADFINGNEAWQVPEDPTGAEQTLPPYYVLAQYPEQEEQNFQLTSTFSPRSSENVMSGMMSAWYDEDNTPNLSLYEVGGNDIRSTRQMHQDMTQDEDVAAQLKDYEQQDMNVQWGNLLALPVGNGVMYVEPMYLQRQVSGEGTPLPLLQQVLVSYGGETGFAPSFAESVEQVIASYTGSDEGADDSGDDTGDEGDEGDEGDGDASPEVQAALDKIDDALADLNQAMEDGDLAAQGQALEDLDAAMKEYDEAKG